MIGGVLAIAVATAMLGPVAPAASQAGSAPPTSVRAIGPLDSNGNLAPAYRAPRHYGDANCESGSPATGKAYECFAAKAPQGVYEACWVEANPSFVACLDKPWLHKAVRLHVTRGYDDTAGFPAVHRPWGIRLGRQTRCLVVLGSVHSAAGHPITYRCRHRIVLTGRVVRHPRTWRIRAYRRIAHHGQPVRFRPLGLRPVAVAWFGKTSHTA